MPRKYQIFVSSTYDDLKVERSLVYEAVLGMGHIPVGMEYFGSRSRDSISVIQSFIDECDYQITIVGTRYGSVIDGETRSYTEMEYDYATSAGVPQIGFLLRRNGKYVNEDDAQRNLSRLKSFRDKVARQQVAFWESPHELVAEIQRALPTLFTDNDRPGWVRGDAASDWVTRQLTAARNELQGVQSALGRYRTNAVESNRRRFETNTLPPPNISGVWQCQEKTTTMELLEYGGTVISHCPTGTHDHWLYGLWSPERAEVQTQVWRRERLPVAPDERRLTVMFGRIFNISENSFETEVFASDGKADLDHNFTEHLTWKRLEPTSA